MGQAKNILVQYLLGIVFIASGITKLVSIDDFQVFIYSLNVVNLNLSLILTRIIIGIELSIGLLYVVGIYKKPISYITLALMVAFTLFALYLEWSNLSDDCHCFGTVIRFSNKMTILKNVVIILLVLYALIYGKPQKLKYNKLIVVLSLFCGFGASLIVRPPNLIFTKEAPDSYYHKPSLDKFIEENSLMDHKRIICFFTYTCKHCQIAAKKMSIISEKTNNRDSILYVFWKAGSDAIDFFEETNTHTFNVQTMDVMEFLTLTNGTMPLIILYNNGVVESAFRSTDMDEDQIIRFLEK